MPKDVKGITYYVNGELVDSPNGKVAVVGEATVVAVPDAWYAIADGATSDWSGTFDD